VAKTDSSRGFDHAVFVPLLGLMPEADIPVVAVSVIGNMDPKVRTMCFCCYCCDWWLLCRLAVKRPCITSSECARLVQAHIEMGRALAPLRDEGVLLLGSGSTFHSLNALFSGTGSASKAAGRCGRETQCK
jgi:aromatic ring-opening dioxygenase catalytic subunit (LigB family)